MNVKSFRCWKHERDRITPIVFACTDHNRRVLAIAAHLPAALHLSRANPLRSEHAALELINEDEGRVSIRAGDVQSSAWELWPEATHISVGGDGSVHVFMEGGLAAWQESCLQSIRDLR